MQIVPKTPETSSPDAAQPTPSPRKLASARANGAKSTGPTTPPRLEKWKNAPPPPRMRAQSVVIQGESVARFNALLNSYIATHLPLTEPEYETVFQMAAATWRQRRVQAFQTMDFNRLIALQLSTNPDPDDDEPAAKTPAAFTATLAFLAACQDPTNGQAIAHRYETTYLRHYDRALRNFIDLRALRPATTGLEPHTVSCLGATNWEEPAPRDVEPDVQPPPEKPIFAEGPNPKNEHHQSPRPFIASAHVGQFTEPFDRGPVGGLQQLRGTKTIRGAGRTDLASHNQQK